MVELHHVLSDNVDRCPEHLRQIIAERCNGQHSGRTRETHQEVKIARLRVQAGRDRSEDTQVTGVVRPSDVEQLDTMTLDSHTNRASHGHPARPFSSDHLRHRRLRHSDGPRNAALGHT